MDHIKLNRFTGHYQTALRDHLAPGAPDGLQVAQWLGKQAVALSLQTLDLARLHEAALTSLLVMYEDAAVQNALTARAAEFFTECLAPLEATHATALKAGTALAKLNATLVRHTADLADSRRAMEAGVLQRHEAERALLTSEVESTRLLTEAQQLQQHLQELARRILTSQEEERRKMSLTLHDEIAQTLLGIQLRLLALQREVSVSTDGFQKKIATTQRLVQKSVQTINRFARECGLSHET
jgi:signal transduction histidine kinase